MGETDKRRFFDNCPLALSLIIKIAHIQEANEMQQMDPVQMDRAIIQLCTKGVSGYCQI